jgi:farnesyl diphosphate synthase
LTQAKTFHDALTEAQSVIAAAADVAFQDRTDPLNAAMHYALDGGKALRGFLVLESARLHKISKAAATPAALAIECIHAYSLIHDDLPCMDDDDLRRGKPTVHKAWDEATAVLAGDALQTLAFEVLTQCANVALIRSFAQAAGRDGMVGGQMPDIEAESSPEPLTVERIIAVQNGKTGALIEWSCTAGALLADADPAPLQVYGERLGLAFQIADDILDVESDAATLGKATQKDAEAGKATFVSLLGLDGAKRRALDLVTEACDSLNPYGDEAECLRDAARFVIDRKK